MFHGEDVPRQRRDIDLTVIYGDHMGDIEDSAGSRFATLIKDGRRRAGLTQEELADVSGVGRTTIIRWESGNTDRPVAEQVRKVVAALGIDPREVPIALGLITREEAELPPPEPRPEMLDALVREFEAAKDGVEKERIADAIATLVAGLRARRVDTGDTPKPAKKRRRRAG